jgi:hypothetical protein
MNPLAAGFLAFGAIAAMSSGTARRAVGIAIEPYITDAHRKAMTVLARSVLDVGATSSGCPAPTDCAQWQALHRYNQVANAMIAYRGFRVVGSRSITRWTAGDAVALAERFLEAVKAGVSAEHRIEDGGAGYRVTILGGFEALPILGTDANAIALEQLFAGKRPSDIPLTDLGGATLAAAQFRNRASSLPQTLPLVDSFLREFHGVMSTLANEMDASGYLESGKPPPEPTLGGGIAAAAHAVGGLATGIAGSVAGGVVTAIVGSPFVWAAGLVFVAWKVL